MVARRTAALQLPSMLTWGDSPFPGTSSVSRWAVFLGHRTWPSPSRGPSSRSGRSGGGFLGGGQEGSHPFNPLAHLLGVSPGSCQVLMLIAGGTVVQKAFHSSSGARNGSSCCPHSCAAGNAWKDQRYTGRLTYNLTHRLEPSCRDKTNTPTSNKKQSEIKIGKADITARYSNTVAMVFVW